MGTRLFGIDRTAESQDAPQPIRGILVRGDEKMSQLHEMFCARKLIQSIKDLTHDFHKDHIIGSILSAFMGLSVCWWKSDHNTHHIVCNAVEHDPNIQHMPMIAITDKIFEFFFWYYINIIFF